MGSGKSSVGRHLAGITGHRFVDTDQLIREKANLEITEIFERFGEKRFREMESQVLQELVGVWGIVLATGGGIVLLESNRRLLHEIGVVIWIDAHPDVLFERVSHNRKRPLLLTENPRATFDRLLSERLQIYEQTADAKVDTSQLTHPEAAKKIFEAALRVIHSKKDAAVNYSS